jgi:monofunctional biosynthetic peptidoglycan transglycosylase
LRIAPGDQRDHQTGNRADCEPVRFGILQESIEACHVLRRTRGAQHQADGYYHIVALGGVRRIFGTVLVLCAGLVIAFYALALAELIALRWINPPTTTVQVQRRIEAWIHGQAYHKRSGFLPLSRISPNLQHAVVSAEDGRFYEHHGIDWKEVQQVIDQDMEEGRLGRGGSTITQQLIKNLFLTTNRSFIRKGVEFTLAPLAERILSKRRILELYLNVIEWGPGIYGAEAAARAWFGVSAAQVNRDQAARLAAVIPAPLRRKPARMTWYSTEIERRMAQRGW